MTSRLSVSTEPQRHTVAVARLQSRLRRLVLGAHGAFAVAAALLVVLHLSARWGGIDPVTAMLSDYALRPGWWMWDLALTVTSAGSAAVLLALHRQGVLRGRIAVSGMGVWCMSVLLVVVFTKDPQGGAVTTLESCTSMPPRPVA
jgi:hypothetical protein